MNKKIILAGMVIATFACLFPPVGCCYERSGLCKFRNIKFLFSTLEPDQSCWGTIAVTWRYLSIELVAIAIVTFGLAYCLDNCKNKKK